MKVSMIAALSENRVIGKDNKLPPWKAPGDLKRFKELTTNKVVIMGRNTYQSIRDMTPKEKEVLPDRLKIVISTTMEPEGKILVVDNLEFAMHFARAMIAKFKMPEEIMIIGGAKVYQTALPVSDRLYLTRVKGEFEGDTYFPAVDFSSGWKLVEEQVFETHSFNTYDRVPVVIPEVAAPSPVEVPKEESK